MFLLSLLISNTMDPSFFLKMIFGAQGVLFPLIALFLCFNAVKYREYIPLYIAGKIIGIFVILGWSILTIGYNFYDFFGELVLIGLDCLALVSILIIKKDVKKNTEEELCG